MILYGASGHGKVILEILELTGDTNISLWDDAEKPPIWSYPVQKPAENTVTNEEMIISIGYNNVRKAIAERLKEAFSFGNAFHPNANISVRAKINTGSVVMAGVTINADTVIGMHAIINTNASVDHDCVVGDYCHISPNVGICGNVFIGEGTLIGVGAIILPGIKIGKWCTIGAGAVVIKDIPDYKTAVGNPARIIK